MFTIEETTVRAAREDDAAGIAAVFAGYVTGSVVTFETEPPTVAAWQARIRAARLPFVVLARESAVLGYAYAAPWRGKPAYQHTIETTVYLAPEHTGKGHGRRLLDALVTRCAGAGYRQAIAVISDTSGASVALHRAAGFTEAGRLHAVGYKHGRWLDTVLMQRSL